MRRRANKKKNNEFLKPLAQIRKKSQNNECLFLQENAARASLGVKICFNDLKVANTSRVHVPVLKLKDGAIPYKEKRRNEYLEHQFRLQFERQEIGRHDFEVKSDAAIKMQAVFRGKLGAKSVSELVAEMKQRMEEEEALKRKLEEDRRKTKEAKMWLTKVHSLPESPLKTLLQNLSGFDIQYDLTLSKGWEGEFNNIVDALRTFTSAKSIALHKCNVANKLKTDDDAKRLATSLVHQKQLETLKIDNCNMNAYDLEAIIGAVYYGAMNSLKELVVTNCWISRGRWVGMDDKGRPTYENVPNAVLSVSNCIRNIDTLHTLNLARNWMGTKAFNAMVGNKTFVKAKNTLRFVNLSFNDLGTKSGIMMTQLLCGLPNLCHLDLSGNGLKATGLAIIESYIASHKSLQQLILNQNELGDDGANVVTRILKSNCKIRTLHLASNKLTEIGITEIASTLITMRNFHSIQSLDLSYNRLERPQTDAKLNTLQALATMIQSCSRTLRALHFRGTNLIQHQKSQPVYRKNETRKLYHPLSILLSTLHKNNTLAVLDIRENGLADAINPPHIAYQLIQQQTKMRPALYVPKEIQTTVASLFKPYLIDLKHEHNLSENQRQRIGDVILRILAFACDKRQIIV